MSRARRLLPLFVLLAAALCAQKPAKQLYVVSYIDVFPNFAADTDKLLAQFASDSRKDTGSVRFEVLKDTVRSNHFTTVEVWRDQADYEAHLMLEHSKTFRQKIQPYLGSPFDERLYYLQ